MPVTVHVRLLLETMLVTGTTAVRQHNLLAAGDDLQAAVETAVHPQALYTPHGQACLTPDTQQLPFCDATLTPAARVKDLIGRLNLTEKIQLTGVVKGDLCAGLDGGVPRLGIEPVSCLIECTGAVSSSCYVDPSSGESFCPTVFPAPAAVAASFNRTLMRLRGAVTGMEARAFNNLHVDRIYGPDAHVDLLAFGPDINLIVDPRNGRNGENPSEDGYLAGAYAVEYVQGAQESPDDPSHLMLSMALKHYAGYESETNRMASNFAFSAFDLLDTFLVPYAMGFKDGRAVGSMCAYDSINNVSSCADKWLLTSMVKEYWRRNDTYTMSDCFAVDNEFTAKHRVSSYAAATAQSVKAGTDWCMGKAYVESNGIADAIKQGLMTEEDVNIALSRTLSVRMRLGMFDSTPTSASAFRRYGKEYINTAASKQAAEEAAAQGAVLLRNEDNALPLNPSTLPSIAIVGPHAVSQRALLGDFYADAFCPGNSTPGQRAEQCVPTVGSSITALLRGHGAAAVRVEAGVPIMGTNETGIAAAVAAVQASTTAILALGYSNKDVEREGADHNFTTLPTGQLALANAVIAAAEAQNSTVVMLLINAGQIATDNLAKQPAAVIECFYPAFGAPALARQIFGLENRWGRLPYTICKNHHLCNLALISLAGPSSICFHHTCCLVANAQVPSDR